MRLGRLQTIGVVLGLVGLFLVAYVSPNLGSDTKAFTFDAPPDPPTLSFTPGVAVATIGVLFLLTAVLTFFERRAGRLATIALVGSGLLFLPLIVIVALALSESTGTNVVQLVVESLRLGTPIALGAMAGLWCERSGVVNIGIEGMMLGSAGIGFMFYSLVGDASSVPILWASVGVAVVTGGLIAALHALMSVTFRVDQIISGVVVNLLALGVTGFVRSEVIVPSGVTSGTPTSDIALPGLSAIPVIGPQLFDARPIFFLMFVGGCSGSTAGGMKIFRFQLSLIILREQLMRLLHPRAVLTRNYNGRAVSDEIISSMIAYTFIFLLCLLLITVALAAMQLDFVTALSGALTSLTNVGPGLGDIIGPAGNFGPLPDAAKWVLSVGMLMGRLEILSVVIVLSPAFWRS